jgi:crotonobetaine/carnitine-CoA ligase
MMRGYVGRPDATAETLRDGWLHTGDSGYADEQGRHYFVGRQKDIIRRSGENVAAAEVEAVLREHPQVLDAAVIPVPDAIRGEEVLAFVIPSPASLAGGVDPVVVTEFCAQRLARHKVPRYLRIWSSEFPRTPSMRVRKDELAHQAGKLSEAWDRSVVLGW